MTSAQTSVQRSSAGDFPRSSGSENQTAAGKTTFCSCSEDFYTQVFYIALSDLLSK
jgi:hypothetical protein